MRGDAGDAGDRGVSWLWGFEVTGTAFFGLLALRNQALPLTSALDGRSSGVRWMNFWLWMDELLASDGPTSQIWL